MNTTQWGELRSTNGVEYKMMRRTGNESKNGTNFYAASICPRSLKYFNELVLEIFAIIGGALVFNEI